MQNIGLSVLLALGVSLLGGCRNCHMLMGDLPSRPVAEHDLIVLDTDTWVQDDKVYTAIVGCWMLKKGDQFPHESSLVSVDRRTLAVPDSGDSTKWDEPLSRNGLTTKQCIEKSR